MGMGDVKLAGVLGLNLGYFSLGSLLLATLFAFVSASLVVLGGMLLRKLSMKSHVPFGPFMILGAAIALGMTP
jgi:leader peptidase (prepilin peptidase)/N-methyltransferase